MLPLLTGFCVLAVLGVLAAARSFDRTALRSLANPFAAVPFVALAWPVIAVALVRSGRVPAPSELVVTAWVDLPLVVLGVVALVWNRRRSSRRAGSVAFAAVPVVAVLIALLVHALIADQSVIQPALGLAMLVPALLSRPSPTDLRALSVGFGAALAAFVCFIGVLVIGFPGQGVKPCGRSSFGKCTDGLVIAFDTGGGNNIGGIMLVVLVAGACALLPLRWAALLWAPVAGLILLTGSRTSVLAVVVVVAFVLLAKIATRWARFCAAALATGVLLISIVPVVIVFPDDAFTDRGRLWSAARTIFAQSPLLGQGGSAWARLPEDQGFASYSPHNIWWMLLVSVGLLGTAAVVATMVWGLRGTSGRGRALILAQLAAIVAIGALESTVMPFRSLPFPGITVVVLITIALARPPGTGRNTEVTSSASP